MCITPGAGVIPGWAAIIFGLFSGTVPWLTMNIVAKRTKLFKVYIDDTLGITHTHMVAGSLGGFLTGLFADKEGCEAFGTIPSHCGGKLLKMTNLFPGITNPGGAKDGNGRQVWVQIVGALFIIAWNMVWTTLILLVSGIPKGLC